MRRGLFDSRLLTALALGAAAVSCAPAPKTKKVATPTPVPRVVLTVHSTGALVAKEGRTLYDDRDRDLTLEVPKGWIGATSFAADDDGPPPIGELRLRARLGPEPYCSIDLALEPLPETTASLQASVARGRDLFYFAQTEVPTPGAIPAQRMWTSTAVPVVPGRTDVGYWIESGDRLIRLEGRFPNDRVPECKAALEGMLGSLAPRDAAGAASRRAERVNPG